MDKKSLYVNPLLQNLDQIYAFKAAFQHCVRVITFLTGKNLLIEQFSFSEIIDCYLLKRIRWNPTHLGNDVIKLLKEGEKEKKNSPRRWIEHLTLWSSVIRSPNWAILATETFPKLHYLRHHSTHNPIQKYLKYDIFNMAFKQHQFHSIEVDRWRKFGEEMRIEISTVNIDETIALSIFR